MDRPKTEQELKVIVEHKAKLAKEPVKRRLARKHVEGRYDGYGEDHIDAYLAGFDRAKALCIDAVARFCDEWVPKDADGKTISQHMANIGDLP